MILAQYLLALSLLVQANGSAAIIHQARTITHVDSSWTDKFFRIEILNDLGKARYGDIKQRYDSQRYRIETLLARTVIGDSTFIEPDTSAISDVSAPEVTRAPEYSRLMMRVVTFPALKPHAIIEYHYRLVPKESKSLFQKLLSIFKHREKEPFFSSTTFQTEDPIDTVSYTLKGKDLTHLKFYMTKSVKTEVYGDTMIVWMNTDVPPIIREEGMVPIGDIAPRLVLSEFGTWDSVASFLASKFERPLSGWKELRPLAREVVGEDTDSAVPRIYNYVLTKIRTVPIDFGSVGYEPTDPLKVNEHGYGDPKDKAVLLCGMLKAAGYDATPVVVRSAASKFIQDVPSPGQFDHVIVSVSLGDSTVYLDPTARFTRYGSLPSSLMGKYAMKVDRSGRLFKLPSKTFLNNRFVAGWDAVIGQDGTLQGKVEFEPTGSFEERLRRRFFGETEDRLTMDFRDYADRIAPGCELDDYTISGVEDIFEPATASMSVKAVEYGVVEGDMMIIELPSMPLEPRILYTSLTKHRYPVLADGPFEISYTWKLRLPNGYRVAYAPQYADTTALGLLEITHTVENGILKVRKTLKISKERVSPEEYPIYRHLGRQFVKESNNLILLEKVGE